MQTIVVRTLTNRGLNAKRAEQWEFEPTYRSLHRELVECDTLTFTYLLIDRKTDMAHRAGVRQ